MSKFCPKCSATVADDTLFCSSCGYDFSQQDPQTEQPSFEPQFTHQPSTPTNNSKVKMPEFIKKFLDDPKSKKFALIGIGALVIIIAAIVVISSFFSPEAVAKKFLDSVLKGDGEAAVNCLLPTNWGYDDDRKDDLVESIERVFERYDRYDKVTYKILRVSDFEDDEIKALQSMSLVSLENRYNEFDFCDITEYKTVTVKVTSFEDDEKSVTLMEFVLVKYKGQWKLLNTGI